MTRHLVPAAAAALLLLTTTPAAAVPLEGFDPASPLEGGSLLLDEGFYFKVHHFPEDSPYEPFAEFINRLHTSVRVQRWNVGMQLDLLANAPPADPETGPVNQLFGVPAPPHSVEDVYLVPEKMFVQYRGRVFKLELGDHYVNVGKGLALSLVRRTEIDEDHSLRGAKVGISTRPVDWTAFGGWVNAQNISVTSINRNIRLPSSEFLFGSAALIRPARWMEFGVHGIGTIFDRLDEDGEHRPVDRLDLIRQPLQMGTFGASLRFPSLGPVDWHTEGDLFVYGKNPDGEVALITHEGEQAELERGYAIYSGAQIFGPSVTFLFEFKRFKNHLYQSRISGVTENALSAAPTLELEEVINPDSQHAVTSNDITGYRMRWTFYVPETAHNVFINFASFLDQHDVPGHDQELIFHPYAGLQLFATQGHHLFVTGGFRGEINLEDDSPTGREYGDDLNLHLYVDGAVVVKASTFEIATNFRCFHEESDDPYEWFSSESALSWNLRGILTVAVLFDATNERASLSGPLAVPGNLYDSDDPSEPLGLFGAAEITVRPTPAMAVKVFAGANKQGLRCTGGVCRWLPGFSGFRTELTFSL